ncbi:hypothetical protein ACH41H_38955 [Streptomyces sp. NPDC020800]|uniref:hypothetical protein n=1 Tax=Streptomyces sp. NPDC020800 TaxID=3365092 RepID=UPI0037A30EFE
MARRECDGLVVVNGQQVLVSEPAGDRSGAHGPVDLCHRVELLADRPELAGLRKHISDFARMMKNL